MFYLKIEIPGLPKTINSLNRCHWAVKGKEVKHWKLQVALLSLYKKPDKPLKTARVSLTRCSSRRPDFDGLVSSFKCIIDGLIEAGVIENDRHENIGQPEYVWEKAKKEDGKIIIEVREV